MDRQGDRNCKTHFSSNQISDRESSSGYSSDTISQTSVRQGVSKLPHEEMKSLFPSEDKIGALGALSPVLSCIRSITDSDDRYSELKTPKLGEGAFRFLKTEECVRNGNGFGMAISLQDGTTIFVTNSITSVLGYPKDMVLGTNLMSFMYPRDQVTFTNHLALGLHSRFDDYNRRVQSDNSFYCRLRQYHSLKFGYGVSDKKNTYKPFKISIRLQEVPSEDSCVENSGQTTCLVATAEAIFSSYTKPEEIPAMSSFSTRHTASCHFSHIDSAAISYLGYLPQDVLGFSIFDYYHMDDMPQLKDIYELVVKEQGNSFRSKPYRLKAFNGSYVVLETEWSCFINPWSRKLEFVLGQHRVLKGPLDPRIFAESSKEDGVVSDEILKESQRIQHEIRTLLEQPVKNHISDGLRGRCPKRKRGLASFVSSLVDVCQGEEQNWHKEDCSCSDHGSVVMGEISPHQEFNDSDPSSVTPPTSQEIRYQENIDRFFASHPKTYSSDGSGESKSNFITNRHTCNMSVDSGKTSADSGNGSMPTQSVTSLNAVSNSQGGGSRGNGDGKYPSCISLTEELLTQHNRMIHKYNNKQRKVKTSSSTNVQLRKDSHRMKRSSSPYWPDGGHKHNKPSKSRAANVPTQTEDSASNEQSNPSTGLNPMSGFNLNPPFSMGSFPSMSHTSSSTPWNSSSVTSSYNNNQAYNAGAPNFGVPNYLYMNDAAGGAPSPFFMPVMYLGAMPIYPSIPPMLPQTTPTGMWPFNFGPACYVGLSVPGSGVNQPGTNQQQTNGQQTNGQQLPQQQTTQNGQHVPPAPPTTGNGTPTVNAKPTVRQNYENMDIHGSSVVNNRNNNNNNNNTQFHKSRPETPICQGKRSNGYTNNNGDNLEANVSSVITSCITTSTNTTQCRNSTKGVMSNALSENRTFLKACGSGNDHDRVKDSDGEKDLQQDDSTSFSSSFLLKSDDFSSQSPSERLEEMEMDLKELKKRPLLKDPPWMDGINMDSDTIYRFQFPSRTMEDVLKKDMEALRNMTQPDLVGKQLAQLQSELTNAAREMQKEITAAQGEASDDHECKAGPSVADNDKVQPTIELGFDTLEEDTTEESDSREADILLNYAGAGNE